MAQQSRILLTLQYLFTNTDEEHDVSSKDIIQMLSEKGIKAPDKRTIEADIDMMISAGYDISKEHRNGVPTRYRIIEREFDTVELKILIDAVAASQFINAERSRRIIQRLASMARIADREGLCAQAENLVDIKNSIGQNLYAADDLYRAIVRKRKVQFQMVDLSVPDMKPVPHRDGHIYTVSPYAMVWKNDRYYLIAHEDDRDIILTPRVDRIQKVKILEDEIHPIPDCFDIGHYYSLSYKMYSGPESDVVLLCENSMIGHIIDHFGRNFDCISMSDHVFRAVVRTSISPTFFGWLFQYAGKLTLEGPPEVVEEYNRHRRKVLKGPKR